MTSKGTIWWDFDGTLVSRPLMWSEAGLRFLGEVLPGHQTSRERLSSTLRTGFPWHRPDHGHPELTPVLWWQAVYQRFADAFRELGCQVAEGHQLGAIREDIINAKRYTLFDDVVPVLDRLHRGGWRHVMVSNHVPELETIVDSLGLGLYFHAVLTSALVGYEKPHARIFEAALKESVPHAPIWMIGDNRDVDCVPAAAFGAEAILVRTSAALDPHASDLWAAARIIEPL